MPKIITREEAMDDMEYICSNYGANQRLIPLLTQSINAIYDNFEFRFKKEQDAHIEDLEAKSIVIKGMRKRLKELKNGTIKSCDGCFWKKENSGVYCSYEYECSRFNQTVDYFLSADV